MLRMRPNILDDLGLAETLHEEIDAWQSRHPNTDCTLSINTDLGGLNEQTEITIYRIVQECLTNIAKHANACNIAVDIDRVEASLPGHTDTAAMQIPALRLSIRDDGVGMEPKARSRGLGLIGIRERAGALDGMLSIQSTPGQGVTIIVTLPLDPRLRS
jgi:signal transduction histidine kinase